MSDLEPFAWLVLVTAAVGLAAVLSNRLTERLKVPAPALVLIAAAVIVKVVPDLHAPPERTAERLVTSRCCASCSRAACTSAGPGSGTPPRPSPSSAWPARS